MNAFPNTRLYTRKRDIAHIGGFSIKRDTIYLHKRRINVIWEIFLETTNSKKLKIWQLVKIHFYPTRVANCTFKKASHPKIHNR